MLLNDWPTAIALNAGAAHIYSLRAMDALPDFKE